MVQHKTYQPHHKPSWNWRLVDNKALAFLAGAAPFLRERGKRRRADLLLQCYKRVTPRNGRYSPEQAYAKQAFEAEFFAGNPALAALQAASVYRSLPAPKA